MARSNNEDRWLKVRWAGGLSGWGYAFGLSWNAANFSIFTPWLGFGFDYAKPVIWTVGPYVQTGVWVGCGKPGVLEEGQLRYRHSTGHTSFRYCSELEEQQ